MTRARQAYVVLVLVVLPALFSAANSNRSTMVVGSQHDGVRSVDADPDPTAPVGLVYAEGTRLMKDGVPLELFGTNDDMAFVHTHWGDYGHNYMFPDFDGTIPGVSSADQFWNQYFRYFLHYQQTGTPRPNLFRVTVGWDFGSEDAYYAWKNNPTAYFANFDAMVKWAKAAGVYLVPMLMQSPNDRPYMWEYFNPASTRYAHLVAFERAVMTRYASEPQIAMWDVFNEADVSCLGCPAGGADFWPNNGGFTVFKAWEQRLVDDVRSATSHLITIGHAMTSAEHFFPNDGFGYDRDWYMRFSDIQGVDVSHIHVYMTAEDQYLVDLLAGWARELNRPIFVGELGYNAYPSPTGAPVPYGHWPWYVNAWRTADVGPLADMTWLDNGRGAYADYPYFGSLPNYPPSSFDFTLSLAPAEGTLFQGQDATVTVTTTLSGDPAESVGFSVSGVPPGVGATFTPTDCVPACSSVLTISTSPSTPTGTYTLIVGGFGGGVNRTASYELTVALPCPSAPQSYPPNAWDRVWCDVGFSYLLAEDPDETPEGFDNDWARGTVASGRADHIGLRSGRTIVISAAGSYTFTIGGDDGVRAWIDGTLVADEWREQAYTTFRFSRSMDVGSHQLRLDYFENQYDARLSFSYSPDPTPDSTAPTAVGDLNGIAMGTQSAHLEWRAPGDDADSGTAASYDIRYSSQGPIDETNFLQGTALVPPIPAPSGATDSVDVFGLTPGIRYWFALRTADEVPNWSALSNVVDVATPVVPPADVTAPAIRLIHPSEGSAVSGDVTVSVWATDANGVASVSLQVNEMSLGVLTSPPYEWTWRSEGAASGTYRLTASAQDPSGNQGNATVEVVILRAEPIAPWVFFVLWDQEQARVEIRFSNSMNRTSVETSLRLLPDLAHSARWDGDTRLFVVLTATATEGQQYSVAIGGGALDTMGTPMAGDFTFAFLPRPPSSTPFPIPLTWIPWLILGFAVLLGIGVFVAVSRRLR